MIEMLVLGFVLAGQSAGQTVPLPTPTPPPHAAPAETGPAPAHPVAPSGPASPDALAVANTGEQEIVCRREAVTGSNRTRRVCERVAVTDYVREQSQRWRETVVDRGATVE